MRTLLAALLVLLTAPSCTRVKNHSPTLIPMSRLGVVADVTYDVFPGQGGGVRTGVGMYTGSALGSMVGRGAASSVGGFLGGMVVGGLIGNAADKADKDVFRQVTVKMKEGELVNLTERVSKRTPKLSIGDGVVVELDQRGLPSRIIPAARGRLPTAAEAAGKPGQPAVPSSAAVRRAVEMRRSPWM